MSIITKYTCDKCNHSQEEEAKPLQMWKVGVTTIELRKGGSFQYSQTPIKQALWCRPCVIKLGLLPAKKDDPTPTPPTTIEDLIREIAEEVVGDAQGR